MYAEIHMRCCYLINKYDEIWMVKLHAKQYFVHIF